MPDMTRKTVQTLRATLDLGPRESTILQPVIRITRERVTL